jgi:hypothetical protein
MRSFRVGAGFLVTTDLTCLTGLAFVTFAAVVVTVLALVAAGVAIAFAAVVLAALGRLPTSFAAGAATAERTTLVTFVALVTIEAGLDVTAAGANGVVT